MAHVAEWKHQELEEITSIITDHKIIGIAEIGSIPAPQMQHMRENLREKLIIRCSKNTLILRALDNAGKTHKQIDGLTSLITGQTAVIATDMNPFKLYNYLKSTRTKAPAKGGETAIEDIVVKAGDTPFKPGPIVGELQKVGIPAAIEGGKVVIKKDKVVVKQGEKILREMAQMLARLEIFPLEIGITMHGAYEDGFIFKADVLDIDIDEYMTMMYTAISNSSAVAVAAAWATKQTITPLIMKAQRSAFALAMEQGILTKDTTPFILGKAHRSMLSIAKKLKDEGVDDDLKKMMT
ncbi:MAG: 50S ribosomal protein L10 [Candidatus Thermoplasmatota archaeon]|nr:50S ribosomal protein L10 [Candidatus Thermoplasmatota archaeon]